MAHAWFGLFRRNYAYSVITTADYRVARWLLTDKSTSPITV
jgi:hypothetical protein